jgi:CMP/dCMP kinase
LAETGRVIAEGRDMGTRVFPDAQVKIYLEATLETRAHRRWLELRAQGQDMTESGVRADMAQRDRRDQERREDPLRIPDGAHCLDSTAYDVAQMEDICFALIQPYLGDC